MRQPFEFDTPQAAAKLQPGKVGQVVDLNEMQGFQFAEASEQAEIKRLAKAQEQRAQMFIRQQRRQIRPRDAGEPEVAQAFEYVQRREILFLPLQVQRFQQRTARNGLERKANRRVGECEFLQREGDVAQAFDSPDSRALDMEPFQAEKMTQKLQILRRVPEEAQLDVAAPVPYLGKPL